MDAQIDGSNVRFTARALGLSRAGLYKAGLYKWIRVLMIPAEEHDRAADGGSGGEQD